ncbi:SDR family oxidoreductase [Sphingobium sp. JS3065]|jgi:NADP-dependent 3-hydroxy acid dehydrogenase YdfG|uniref:SDR family oxidoreductase n=1 Tax=Sphingobium sp. JS3065 TaxID=2970925 RepID=UPI002265071A|nr:SDR family oxidoreductase [Sphingobium sp. JS3065]UZW54915.1 SDR family oxidoreductase [Sphingobium sp. JS3065]
MMHTIDKVVLITGASSGIGEATTRELVAAGARLFIGARRTERLKALANELGENVAWQELDVTDGAAFDAFADAAEERFGRIDALVNNAGIMPLSMLASLKRDEWKRMIDVNIHGVLNGIAAVLPRFVTQENGHVINVASVAARIVTPASSVYSATKHAVRVITDGLRQEHNNIRATLISPGPTTSELGHDVSDPDIAAWIQQGMPDAQSPFAIAQAIRYALEQPDNVDVSEMVVRPTASPF